MSAQGQNGKLVTGVAVCGQIRMFQI